MSRQGRRTSDAADGASQVVVRGEGIRVGRTDRDVGVAEARRRFGGVDIPASLAGTVAALGTAVLVGGVASGAGRVGYQLGVKNTDKLSAAGLAAGLATLLVAFLVGGWVAGRMARYHGGRNGLMTAVWFVALAAVVAGLGVWLGDRYNFFAGVHLPQWFSHNAGTSKAVLSGLAALAVMVVGAVLGGKIGDRYHRRIDALIAATRPGAVAQPESVSERVADSTASRETIGRRR